MEKCNTCHSVQPCSGFNLEIRTEESKLFSVYNCDVCNSEFKKELEFNNQFNQEILTNLLREVRNENDT